MVPAHYRAVLKVVSTFACEAAAWLKLWRLAAALAVGCTQCPGSVPSCQQGAPVVTN